MTTQQHLADLSGWIDSHQGGRDPEAITWGRLSKITEEAGEVISAFIGYTGQNPRKGRYASDQDVVAELLDVAVTALGAVEHLTGNQGEAMTLFDAKVRAVWLRALDAGMMSR